MFEIVCATMLAILVSLFWFGNTKWKNRRKFWKLVKKLNRDIDKCLKLNKEDVKVEKCYYENLKQRITDVLFFGAKIEICDYGIYQIEEIEERFSRLEHEPESLLKDDVL